MSKRLSNFGKVSYLCFDTCVLDEICVCGHCRYFHFIEVKRDKVCANVVYEGEEKLLDK